MMSTSVKSAATFFCLSLLLTACSRPADAPLKPSKAQNAKPVIAEAVTWQPLQSRVEVVGSSRAKKSVTLFSKVSGEITKIHFSTGDKVAERQALIQLDDKDMRYQVALAEVELADAKRLLDKYQKTRDTGAVTSFQLSEAASSVESAEINLARSKNLLAEHSIKAPFAGFVGLMDLDIGAHIDPATPLVSIDDRSSLLVTFEVPELYFGHIRQGQVIELSAWKNTSKTLQAKVVDVDSRIKAQSRTFTVRAEMPNQDDSLRPGMSYKVSIVLEADSYPKVSELALQWGGDGAYVWQVVENTAKKVPVAIVKRLPGFLLLEGDLAEGSLVITEGTQGVRAGQALQLSNTSTQ
jgi:RND family efflux transporter MFP subunit